jgi:hypothetical protein
MTLQSQLIGSHTPDGYVVRKGDQAWRLTADGSVDWSAHEGPWVRTSKLYTPADVLHLMAEAAAPAKAAS